MCVNWCLPHTYHPLVDPSVQGDCATLIPEPKTPNPKNLNRFFLNRGLHPLHHACLEAYMLLAPASRVMHRMTRDVTHARKAAAYALLLAAAGGSLLSAGAFQTLNARP